MSFVELEDFCKGGPYIGPKGGKWADAAHTIPWKASAPTASAAPAASGPSLGSAVQSQDVEKVKQAVSALKTMAAQKGQKGKAKAALQSALKEARSVATTMNGRYEADRRRATPVKGRERYTHEHVMRARDIRDMIDSARAEVTASGKSEATKQKESAKADTQAINYRKNDIKKQTAKIKEWQQGGRYGILTRGALNDVAKRHKEIVAIYKDAGEGHEAAIAHHQGLADKAAQLLTAVSTKGASQEQIAQARENLKTLADPPVMKKGETMDDFDLLKAYAGGLPTGEPKQAYSKSPAVEGGSPDGGNLEGTGTTSGDGSGKAGPGQAGATGQVQAGATKKDKFSEDDAEDEKQMKPHTKPIERIKKSYDGTPQSQRDQVAHEIAVRESSLRKGVDYVTHGPGVARTAYQQAETQPEARYWAQDAGSMVRYSNASDLAVDRLQKAGETTINEGAHLGFGAPRALLQNTQLCKADCGASFSKALTACPSCGHGAAATASQGATLRKAQTQGPYLRARKEEVLYLPNGVK